MRLLVSVIALCWIRNSVQMVKFHQDITSLENQLGCVTAALETYRENYLDTWIFSKNSSSHLYSLLKVPITVTTDWDFLRKRLFTNIGALVMFLEGNSRRDLDGLMYLEGIITARQILVMCITNVVCSSEIYMEKIIKMVASAELHYITVDERGIVQVYEYTTTAEGNCGIAQFQRIGKCSHESIHMKISQTSVNYHKCPIRVVSWYCPPYSEPCPDADSNQLCGIAGYVVRTVIEKFNATPVVLTVESPEEVRRHVANKDADLGFGELDNRPFVGLSHTAGYMFVQATIIASRSTWIVKRSHGNILQPLEGKVWLGISVVVVAIFISRRLFPSIRQISALQLFGIILGIPMPRQPQRFSSRIYFFSLVLFGYLFSQAYLINITQVLSTPHQQIIKTLDDLENSGLKVTGDASPRELFENDYPRIYRDYQVQSDLEYYENLALLLQGHSNSILYIEELDTTIAEWQNVEALHDRFNWSPIVLAAPNVSTILSPSSKIVLKMCESGILNAYRKFAPTHCNPPKHHKTISYEKSGVLGFHNLRGLFLLLISGLSLSFFVFLIEIVTPFVKKKKYNLARGS